MSQLGIDPVGLLAQIINFALVLWLLKKFLYGPVLKILQERKNKIEKSLDNVKEIETRLALLEDNIKQKLNQAHEQADEILKAAKQTSGQIEKQAQDKAKEQTQQILAKAEERLRAQEKQLVNEVSDQVTDLAALMLEKALKDLDLGTKTMITKNALKKAAQAMQ